MRISYEILRQSDVSTNSRIVSQCAEAERALSARGRGKNRLKMPIGGKIFRVSKEKKSQRFPHFSD